MIQPFSTLGKIATRSVVVCSILSNTFFLRCLIDVITPLAWNNHWQGFLLLTGLPLAMGSMLVCSRFPRCEFNADIPERPGYVYVLSNPGYRRNGLPIVKIGYTTNSMENSLKLLDKTGVPFPFVVEYKAMVWKAWATMRQAHIALSSWRLNPDEIDRDFFFCSIQQAVDALKKAVQGDIGYRVNRPPELSRDDDEIDPEIELEPEVEEQLKALAKWRADKRTTSPGYVYVLTNDVYHNGSDPLLKIGYTTWAPDQRAGALYRYKDLDYRGVPQQFKVVHEEHFERAFDAEEAVHKALETCRVNPYREFFSCSLEQAQAAIAHAKARESGFQVTDTTVSSPDNGKTMPQVVSPRSTEPDRQTQRSIGYIQSHWPEPVVTRQPHQRSRSRSRSGIWKIICFILAGGAAALGSGYIFSTLCNWWSRPPAPMPMPAIHAPVDIPTANKKPGHASHKKHHSPRKHKQAASPVEPDQADGLQSSDVSSPCC
ncbi:hypothetical protein HNQ50_000136 [Silvimonas terrae]|uniref:Bacteriophage T5 Orf172 DNA-binding domain-containing protein n=1 Tax=Silvimonas terrae TaxID=300266 RepID=A0A840RAE6_9NEIS|nr:GIY-YIG nuclease family protein [Silvimonas terrae]MBB5189426.1 hypothetical protein [Silvimonas terrae]